MCSGRSGYQDYTPLNGGRLKCPLDNDARMDDCLETVRILVEEGQCDPMGTTCSGDDWWAKGSSPLHMFTGPMETFKYLLTQEEFMVDLDTRSHDDLSVSACQLIFSWPYSAANAKLALQAAGNLEQVAKQRSV
jgi:hypothetical protein